MFNSVVEMGKHNDLNASMKTYYKILGVKETASEEEIRERWIKLMRRLHPDQAGEKGSDGQRIREINEAYEVLKHSSSRVKYDFIRTYDRRKKRASLRRAVLRKSYLLLFPILIGLIYFSIQKDQPLSSPKQAEKLGTDSVRKSESTFSEEENARFRGRRFLRDPFVGTGTARSPGTDKRAPKGRSMDMLKEAAKKSPEKLPKGAPKEIREDHSRKISRVEPVSDNMQPVFTPFQESSKPAKIDQTEHIDAAVRQPIEERKHSTVPPQEKNGAPPDRSMDSNTPQLMNSGVAKEDEVEKFLEGFLSCYAQKDINGLIHFFSSGAIQNKRENINEIKKTYEQFFNQSQSLIYHLKNPRIEILPDHAQVKASYEIRQFLKTGGTLHWKGNIEWALIREGGELKISSIQYEHDRSP